jgi:hypothetical protein
MVAGGNEGSEILQAELFSRKDRERKKIKGNKI